MEMNMENNSSTYEIEDIGLNVDTSEYSNEEDIYSERNDRINNNQRISKNKNENDHSNISEDSLQYNEIEEKKNLKFRHNLFKAVLLIMVSIFILLIFSFFNFELSDKNSDGTKSNKLSKNVEGKLIKNDFSISLMNEIYNGLTDYNINTKCNEGFYRYNLLLHVPCTYNLEQSEYNTKIENIEKNENKTFTNSIYNGSYIDFSTEEYETDLKAYDYDNFVTFYVNKTNIEQDDSKMKVEEFNCLINIFSIFSLDINEIADENLIKNELNFESTVGNKLFNKLVVKLKKENNINYINNSLKKSYKTVISNLDVIFIPNFSFYSIESCWNKSSIEKIDVSSLNEMRFTINSINRNKANLINTFIKGK